MSCSYYVVISATSAVMMSSTVMLHCQETLVNVHNDMHIILCYVCTQSFTNLEVFSFN